MRVGKIVSAVISLVLLVCTAIAQERSRVVNASLVSDGVTAAPVAAGPTYIPAGSKVYVAYISGLPHFENNLVAAFQKKKVNLLVLTDRSLADFEIMALRNRKRPVGPRSFSAAVYPSQKRTYRWST